MNIAKSFVRVGAVIRKELREIARRPGALLSLTLGPLAVLALFGIGYTGNRAPVDVAVVIPRGVELPREVATYDKIAEGSGARVVTVTDDVAVARPLRPEVKNDATPEPTFLTFFTPAVLALVLQHLGITLTALSMVRERLTGAMDIFRVAPISAVELLVGKYVSYGILGLAIAALLVLAITNGLHLPFQGSFGAFAIAVILLTFASLGLGLLISLIADTERQAVQLSML